VGCNQAKSFLSVAAMMKTNITTAIQLSSLRMLSPESNAQCQEQLALAGSQTLRPIVQRSTL
jgi:hypothetical protein